MDLPGEVVAALLLHPIAPELLLTMAQRSLVEQGPDVVLNALVEPVEDSRLHWLLLVEMLVHRCPPHRPGGLAIWKVVHQNAVRGRRLDG